MAKEFVFHYEHYPHYMGTQNSESKVDITELDALSDRYIADKNAGSDDIYDDVCEALNGYAQYELIENWPKIRRTLERKGVWSGRWEEGSHALSMTNVGDARSEVGKIEAEIAADEFDW